MQGDWNAWIDRRETRRDRIDESVVTRWLATLDRAACDDGSVPQGFHWCLCLPDSPTSKLGADGHPARDNSEASLLPPVPLPRRMWAASDVEFVEPLRPGQAIVRTSRVASIIEKQGGTGTLVFAEIVHETRCEDIVCVRETQSIVYREAAPAGSPPAPPPSGDGKFDASEWETCDRLVPSEPQLFRYSALTFNSHRIHYDLPYATGEEGYRGLVVHGPLTATLLLDLTQRRFGDNALKRLAFRGLSPAICGEELHLALRSRGPDIELGAFAADGRRVMVATAAV